MSDDKKYQAEAAAVAEVAAEPQWFPIEGDDRDRQAVACPPGWVLHTIDTHQEDQRPRRMVADGTFGTAEGWAAEMSRLSGKRTPLVMAVGRKAIVGHPNPTSIDEPTFDTVSVTLEPKRSAELSAWVLATGLTITEWERHVENSQVDIDGAATDPKAPSFLDILADARTWNTEAKRVVRVIKGDNGMDEEASDEIKMKALGSVLRTFAIMVPVFEFGPPVKLNVVVERDIDGMRISARIPGLDRLEHALRTEMFERAASIGGWTIVR